MSSEVFDAKGQSFLLGKRLGRGGEGEVFEVVGRPELVAKILHPAGRTRAKLDKVEAMLANPPAGATDAVDGFPVLTWPKALLHSRPTGQGPATFQGYAMARIRPGDFVPFSTLTSAARRQGVGGPAITWDRLVLLAMRLSHLVRTLHRFGYAVGDLNDRNVLVSRRLTPLLMDTDSFQVPRPGLRGGHYPSIVGDQQYWAPELLAVDLATYKGSRVEGDRHALGVLLFQLLMGGWRPYQATGSAVVGLETLADKTKAGNYPWSRPKRGVLEPPASAPRYASLPAGIRQAFERCFVDGHRRPVRRPTADDWHATLARVRADGFQACSRQPTHVYSARERACPWCQDPNDPFAARSQRSRRKARAAPVVKQSPAVARPIPVKTGHGVSRPTRKAPPQRPLAPPAPKPTRVTVPKPRQPQPVPTKQKPKPKEKRKARPARPKPSARRKRRRARLRRVRRNLAWVAYTLLAVGTGALAWASG